MKKITYIIFFFIIVFSLVSCEKQEPQTYPEEYYTEITVNEIKYKFSSSNNTFRVSEPVNKNIKNAIIESEINGYPVTSISYGAFEYCDELETIYIPEGITSISDRAFSNCKSLKSIDLPKTITSIGRLAFWECKELDILKIPAGVTTIQSYTSTDIGKIYIPSSVTTIEREAFIRTIPSIYYEGTENEWYRINIDPEGNEKWTRKENLNFNRYIGATQEPKYKVSYETNGSNYLCSDITTGIIEIEPQIEKPGHIFKGWYYESDLINKVTFPLKTDKDITLYAKWLKIYDYKYCNNTHIKNSNGFSSEYKYSIEPKDFNIDELREEGYKNIIINIRYDVYYKKDYNVPLDIGYLGAPKYEVDLFDASYNGASNEDQKATQSSQTKTISCKFPLNSINKIYFIMSTKNIQNIVYFENISVTYTCTY